MIISGLVIDVEPAACSDTLAALQVRPGVTRIEGPVTPGRLVAVVEAEDHAALDVMMGELMAAPGVLSVSPAYIHFDA